MSHSNKGGFDESISGVLAGFTIVMIVLVIVLACLSDCSKRGRRATVVDRTHAPATISVGLTSGGDMMIIGNADTWELILRDEGGNVYALDVTPEAWAGHPPGSDFNKPTAEAMPEGTKL